MCKHILNAQVQIRAACCKKWFDCPECHLETEDHEIFRTTEIIMACKKCKKVFRKEMTGEMDEADEYCPRCDNHYVIPAQTPEQKMVIEFEQERGFEHKMFIDEREKDRDLALQ